tara:strand:+ start:134 stop:964 length:831 start_codon:yes stop_codon:yes gene_type:complete
MIRCCLIFFLFLHVSCFKTDSKDIVASVYDKHLTLKEVLNELPENGNDSLNFFKNYVERWVKDQLLVYSANINLSNDAKDFDILVEKYRQSLLIYNYQQELINQKFDATIENQDIVDYYNKYSKDLRLSKNIFKGRFVILDKNAPNQERLKYIFSSTDSLLNIELVEYCQQFATDYYLQDTIWQYFSAIKRRLPIDINKEDNFLKSTKSKQFSDDKNNYYIFIKDFMIKNSISPLDFEYNKIQDLLLNRKKLDFLKKIEDDLYQNALNSKKIKIYQ